MGIGPDQVQVLVQLEKHVLSHLFRDGGIAEKVISNAVDHRLVAAQN